MSQSVEHQRDWDIVRDRAIQELPTVQAVQIVSSQANGTTLLTAYLGDKMVGELKITLTPFVHDMEITADMTRKAVADALFHYASGYVKASGFSEAAVLVAPENEKMLRYVGERAIQEDPSRMFLMEVK